MKRIIATLLVALVVVSFVPFSAFAADGNLDGVGGTLGKALNNWYVITAGSGARITVVTEGEEQVGESFDWLNSAPFGASAVHFGKHSKLFYRGAVNSVNDLLRYRQVGGYVAEIKSGMPQIVLASGSNIAAIRNFFTNSGTVGNIAARVGAGYTYGSTVNVGGEDINGMYVVRNGVPVKCCIVVEPLVSISCGGTPIVCTATELGYYDQCSLGVQYYLSSVSRQQAPLALFLQRPQLGFKANNDAGVYRRSRADVISYLGIGIVSFNSGGQAGFTPDAPDPETPEPPVDTPPSAYTYHTNTVVYTSVKVDNTTGRDIKEGDKAVVKFTVTGNGVSATSEFSLILPKERSQLAYIRWTTPASAGNCTVKAEVNCGLTLSCEEIPCAIVDPVGVSEPPDPKATDKNPSWSLSGAPSYSPLMADWTGSSGSKEWGHWAWQSYAEAFTRTVDMTGYNEVGTTVASGWIDNAFTSNKLYDDTPLQEFREFIPAEYDNLGAWDTVTKIGDGDVPEATDDLEVITIERHPIWRGRSISGYYNVYTQQYKWYSYSRTYPIYEGQWRRTGASRVATTTPSGSYPYRWVNTGWSRTDRTSKQVKTYRPNGSWYYKTVYTYTEYYNYAEECYGNYFVRNGTETSSGYSVPSGWTQTHWEWKNGTGNSFSTTPTQQAVGSTGNEYWEGGITKRNVVSSSTVRWHEWSGWQETPATGYDEIQNSLKVVYKWRSRHLVSEQVFVYAQRGSYWQDGGSGWYSTTTTDTWVAEGGDTKTFMWITEKASLGCSDDAGASLATWGGVANQSQNTYTVGDRLYFPSGYGVNVNASISARYSYDNGHNILSDGKEVWSSFAGSNTSDTTKTTALQRNLVLFPEFNYSTYGRVLVNTGGTNYSLPTNRYSRFNGRVHFTPLWYPDETKYDVDVWGFDVWSPAGELYFTEVSNNLGIDGNVYDDWFVTGHE